MSDAGAGKTTLMDVLAGRKTGVSWALLMSSMSSSAGTACVPAAPALLAVLLLNCYSMSVQVGGLRGMCA